MVSIYIKLSLIWVATMLTYLLGDVIRIFSGDFTPGEVDGKKMPEIVWFGIAVLMVIPILMVVLSLVLPDQIVKWSNIIVATFFILFNLLSIGTYKKYDQFLLVISMIFNVLVIYYAWDWEI